MLAKDEELQVNDEELGNLRRMIQSKSHNSCGLPTEFLSTLAANRPSTTRPLQNTSKVSEAIPSACELLCSVPIVQTALT